MDLIPPEAFKDLTAGLLTDAQVQEVLGRALLHNVFHGAKVRLEDVKAVPSATPTI
jgi:uncharacterized protein YwbE